MVDFYGVFAPFAGDLTVPAQLSIVFIMTGLNPICGICREIIS
jgi:hypothetical protein